MAYMDDVMRDCAERDAAYEERKAKEFHEKEGPREQERTCPNCGKTAKYMCGYCSELGGWGQIDCANCGYAWNCEEGVTNQGKKESVGQRHLTTVEGEDKPYDSITESA